MDSRYIYHWKKTSNYGCLFSILRPKIMSRWTKSHRSSMNFPWISHKITESRLRNPQTPHLSRPAEATEAFAKATDVMLWCSPGNLGDIFLGSFQTNKMSEMSQTYNVFSGFFCGKMFGWFMKDMIFPRVSRWFSKCSLRHEESPCNWDGLRLKKLPKWMVLARSHHTVTPWVTKTQYGVTHGNFPQKDPQLMIFPWPKLVVMAVSYTSLLRCQRLAPRTSFQNGCR